MKKKKRWLIACAGFLVLMGAGQTVRAQAEAAAAVETSAGETQMEDPKAVAVSPTPVPVRFLEPPDLEEYLKTPVEKSADNVRAVQTALRQAGYNLKVDGIFGNETAAAIRAYQEINRMQVDGELTVELMGSLGLMRLPYTPEPEKADPRVYENDRFELSLYEGRWYRLRGKNGQASYRVYLPAWWQVMRGSKARDPGDILTFEAPAGESGFDLVYLGLTVPGSHARDIMSALEETALFYDGYHFENTWAADCRIADFEGLMLQAVQEEGHPSALTVTFAGRNEAGQVLVMGFSCTADRRLLRRQLENLCCSVEKLPSLSPQFMKIIQSRYPLPQRDQQ